VQVGVDREATCPQIAAPTPIGAAYSTRADCLPVSDALSHKEMSCAGSSVLRRLLLVMRVPIKRFETLKLQGSV
jgi:hypothetical protein